MAEHLAQSSYLTDNRSGLLPRGSARSRIHPVPASCPFPATPHPPTSPEPPNSGSTSHRHLSQPTCASAWYPGAPQGSGTASVHS